MIFGLSFPHHCDPSLAFLFCLMHLEIIPLIDLQLSLVVPEYIHHVSPFLTFLWFLIILLGSLLWIDLLDLFISGLWIVENVFESDNSIFTDEHYVLDLHDGVSHAALGALSMLFNQLFKIDYCLVFVILKIGFIFDIFIILGYVITRRLLRFLS